MSTTSRIFLNAYLQLFLSAILLAGAEIFLKIGATQLAVVSSSYAWTGVQGLGSTWVWGAIVLLVLSFASWLWVLRNLPLSVAYPLANVVHILIPLGSWLFLGEKISAIRWCGVALLVVGLTVLAQPLSRIEERL